MKKFLPNLKGFTLVELLVVISIIAILSMIGMVMYTGVQKNARDAKRKEDVQAIQKALESHYNDTACGAVPTSAPYCRVTATTASILFANGSIPSYPPNPNDASATYVGYPTTAASAFTVCAKLENPTGNYDYDPVSGYTPNPTNTGPYYCLNNQQ